MASIPSGCCQKPSFAEPIDKPLKVVTYNVLADKTYRTVRVPKLIELLKNTDADIIALQEVTRWFVEDLRKQDFLKEYNFPTRPIGGEAMQKRCCRPKDCGSRRECRWFRRGRNSPCVMTASWRTTSAFRPNAR